MSVNKMPKVGDDVEFKATINVSGCVRRITNYFGTPMIIVETKSLRVTEDKEISIPLALWEIQRINDEV